MKLSEEHIRRLENFLDRIKDQTYPEPPSQVHTSITQRLLAEHPMLTALPPGTKVLDVGCGQGVALKIFKERGMDPIGIALNPEDVRVCQQLGYNVLEMDQSFLDFPENSFDMIWCRHCIEHSVFPFFTLSEFNRVLRPGGLLYIEVPASDTSSHHQNNKNHYSTLGQSLWISLIQRSGFAITELRELSFVTGAGPDKYWAFITHKGNA